MTMRASPDVFVIGGGPAGLAAAIAAAQKGMSVTVADIAEPPIDKACGEGLMPDSLHALSSLGVVLDRFDHASFRGIRFLGENDSVEAKFSRGVGIGIRRTILHDVMVERARDLGIRLLWRARVRGVEKDAVHVNGEYVRCRWIVGADGQNSRVRAWAGLANGRNYERRVGLRQHFRIQPWSDFVEIYWGESGQAYVTPIASNEICVALISRRRFPSFDEGLAPFPALRSRLHHGFASSDAKGAVTITRRLRSVVRGNLILVGEASGSADAITGEGLAISFRQASALGEALAGDDLSHYCSAHRETARLPHLLGRSMLLMDKYPWLRSHALHAFARRPGLFARLLAVHVGEITPSQFGIGGLLRLGWGLLSA